jgi:hypothetical protein
LARPRRKTETAGIRLLSQPVREQSRPFRLVF